MSTAPRYYYINGKISTCRRCKRKRTLDEPPEHLKFKTCYRCRMIERDQKKGHQGRRNHSAHSIRKPPHHTHSVKVEAIAQQINSSKPTVYLPQMITNTSLGMMSHAVNMNQEIELQHNASVPITDMGPTRSNVFIDMTHTNISNSNGSIPAKDENFVLYNPQFKEARETNLKNLGLNTTSASTGYLQSFPTSYPMQLSDDTGKNEQLLMSPEQKEAMLNNFLFQLREDQQQSKSLRSVYTIPTVNQCMNCFENLEQNKLGIQICEACQHQKSVIHAFSYYLTILRRNKKDELCKVNFISKINLNKLLALSGEKTGKDVATCLYEEFIFPINEATGAEFVVLDQKGDQKKKSESKLISLILKCTNDPACSKDVSNDNIDPEALLMDSTNFQSDKYYVTSTKKQKRGCDSLITISYDLRTGDLAMSFSHKAHQ